MGVNGFMARPETGRPVTGRSSAMSYRGMTQADEEKKVEAVRDFYENAVGDDLAVERLQAVARIWVPASVLAFSILYWGYGLSFFFEWM